MALLEMKDAIFEWKAIMSIHCECGKYFLSGSDNCDENVIFTGVCPSCGKTKRLEYDDFHHYYHEIERDGINLPAGLYHGKNLNINSYIDNTMRYIFITSKDQFVDIDNSSFHKMPRKVYLETLYKAIPSRIKFDRHKSLLHEYHHGFQTVFYPFLYLQSWLEQETIMLCGQYFKSEKEDLPIEGIAIPEEFRNTLSFQSDRIRLIVKGINDLEFIPHSSSQEYPDDVSLIDLLENATSIFEYRAIAGKDHSSSEFCKWLKINVRYQNIFWMLSKLIGIDAAYNYLPVITLVSFHTTYPMGAFWSLANFIAMNGFHEGYLLEDIDFLHDMLMKHIQREPFPKVQDIIAHPPLKSIPKTTITFNSYQSIVDQTPFHTAYHMAQRYLLMTKKDKDFPKLFYHPDVEENLRKIAYSVPPPVIIVNLSPPYLHDVDRVVFIDNEYAQIPFPLGKNMTYGAMTLELLRQKDFFWRLFNPSLNEEVQPRCPHKDCESYSTKVCSFWPSHSEKSECWFAEWLYNNYMRKVDIKRRVFTH